MKSNLSKQFAVGALALVCSLGVSAKTIYVATDGNNSNDGSESAPYASFWKANSVLVPGDTLMIGGGVYHQEMSIGKSGTEAEPILIRAKNGEQVVIKGTDPINGWTHYSGNIYQASVQMNVAGHFRQVYQNDELMQIARWPNDTDSDPYTLDASIVTGQGTTSSIPTEQLPAIDFTGSLIWYLGQHSGTSWTRTVTGNSSSELSFTEFDPTQWPYSNHTPAKFTSGGGFGRFYVFNKFEFLDNAKEWFYDSENQVVYFQTEDGNAPADGAVEYTVRATTINLNGSYIDVEGIDVRNGFIKLAGNFNRIADANVTHGLERYGSVDSVNGATIFEGSIQVLGQNNLIENSVIEYGSANGITVAGFGESGNNTVIQNNVIRYFNTLGLHSSPVRSAGDNVRILKNTMSHTARDGMFVSGIGSEVAYNDVSQTGLINNDGGPFYTVGNANLKNIEVHHNWFHDAAISDFHDNRIAGIYLDNHSKGFLVHHNVVWNMPWSGVQLNWDNWENNIYHNTFVNVEQAMGEWINGYNPRDNRVWNNYSTALDWIQSDAYDLDHNIISPANQFIDSDNNDFMPNATSLLLDSARIIDDLAKPFVGPAPDVGAYEAGGVQWTAGVNAIEDTCDACASDTNSAPVYAPVTASASFDDRSKYLDTTYSAGDLEVSINYDAGTGNTVSDVLGGVRFLLRLIDSSTGKWVPISDVGVDDASAIGQRAGVASASISLAGLAATADLPEDHFYFLFVQFESSTGLKTAVNVQPIKIGEDTTVPSSIELLDRDFLQTNAFSTADNLTMTVNYEAGTGNTIQIRNNYLLGVRFHLREMTADFKVVGAPNSLFFNDETAIGMQTGQASATFSLVGLTPTADLPEGHYYQLGASFKSTGDTGNNGINLRVNIVAAAPEAVAGDWDGDGDVDMTDVRALISAIQARQDIDLAFDMNNDGVVNVLDARAMMAVCTRSRCAV